MMNARTMLILLIAAMAIAVEAGAQLPPPPLVPLDESRADVGPLSTSLRKVDPKLRQPSDFDDVYHVPGRDDLLMRIDGGMVAVFPRSTYKRTRKGTIPLIPPGTVFYIGIPTHLAMSAPDPNAPLPGAEFRVQRRVSTQVAQYDVPHAETATAEAPLMPNASDHAPSELIARDSDQASTHDALPNRSLFQGATVANDTTYRARRLKVLIQQAANATEPKPSQEASTALEESDSMQAKSDQTKRD